MTVHRGIACFAALAIAAGLSAGCEEVKEKAKRVIDEQKFKVVEEGGEAARQRLDAGREAIEDKAGEKISETAETEPPADAELRKEAAGKSKPSEEEDLTK
jgi:hypothetical protein